MADALHTPGVTSAAEARFDDAGLLAVGSGGLTAARTGVLAGPGSTALVTGTSSTSPMRYSVAAHHWVTSRGVVSDGVYRGGAEAAVLVDTTAAPGSGSRIDVLWVKQQDASSTISADGATAPQYGCTQGNSSTGTPAVPPIPVGAEELARVTVTSAATRTDGAGVTITQTAKQTVARGAAVPVRNVTERDALTAYPSLAVSRLDDGGRIEVWSGSEWRSTTPITVSTMAARPTSGRWVGMEIRPANHPGLLYTWDGTRWVGQNISADIAAGAPAGSYVSRWEESVVTTVIDTNGRVRPLLTNPFSAAPLRVPSWADGDWTASSAVVSARLPAEDTATYVAGFLQRTGFVNVPNGTTVRINFTAIGYNT